ncbi:hypothetical protein GCM10028857_24470 [Salinarchaeum chitinilyticum]
MTSTVANRLTNVETADDPNALLGIQGVDGAPYDEITVINNADGAMALTVSTQAFRIENGPSDHQPSFTLVSGGSRDIQFAPENGNRDAVSFVAEVQNSDDQPFTIDLERTISLPATPDPGSTFRIRNVHSGLYLDADAPGDDPWWDPPTGDVYQSSFQESETQHWTVQEDWSGTTLEQVSSGGRIGTAEQGNSFQEAVNVGTPDWWASNGEQWNLIENADGTYRIENAANPGDVLDVEGGSTSEGANVILYGWKGNDVAVENQKWVFEPV